MRYLVTKEIKSETQVIWKFYFQDFVFLVIWAFVCLTMRENVHDYLQIPYLLFSGIVGIGLMLPAVGNPKRRMYQAIALYLLRTKKVIRWQKKENAEDEGKEKEHTQIFRYQGRYTDQGIRS